MRPTRAEPYVEHAKLLRQQGDLVRSAELADALRTLPPCTDSIFVDIAAHTWRPWAELALTEKLLGNEAAYEAAYSRMAEWRTDAPPL